MKKFYVFTFSILFAIINLSADEVTWTGASGDNKWNNPNNWSTGQVPNSSDFVTIPEGTPTCKLTSGQESHAASITNHGTIELNGAQVVTNLFNNHGVIDVTPSQGEYKTQYQGTISSENLMFNNHGEIKGEAAYLFVEAEVFNNSGNINIDQLTAFVEDFTNTSSGWCNLGSDKGYVRSGSEINCSNEFINNGHIQGQDDAYVSSDIKINADNITNDGTIFGGNSQDEDRKGGDVILKANGVITNTGMLRGGASPGRIDGKVVPEAEEFINKGRCISGDSEPPASREIYFNNMFISAETILIESDSVDIMADTLEILFKELTFNDFDHYGVVGEETIIFRGTENATLDLSTIDDGIILTFGLGPIKIYCDNIVEPAGGLDIAFNNPPEVYASDLSYINASIDGNAILNEEGESGTLEFVMQNQSTINRTFEFEITSNLGWADSETGTTSSLEPFEFYTFEIDYSIPENADTLVDTVIVNVSIPGTFETSAVGYISSNPTIFVSVEDHKLDKSFVLECFPNPITSSLTIESNENCKVEIIDLNGQICFDFEALKGQKYIWEPDMHLPNGIYLITTSNNSSQQVSKIILKR